MNISYILYINMPYIKYGSNKKNKMITKGSNSTLSSVKMLLSYSHRESGFWNKSQYKDHTCQFKICLVYIVELNNIYCNLQTLMMIMFYPINLSAVEEINCLEMNCC